MCVIDDGQFFDLATRLSREFGKVYFHNPTLVEGFPRASKWSIGRGFKEVEWIEKLWTHKDKIDLFIFPDILTSDTQIELEAQGKRVIGSRTGDRLEVLRIAFKKVQERMGLHVPKHVVIDGLDALRQHLKTVTDKYIKISRFRGSFETKHHINYDLSIFWLDRLAVELGPLADELSFLVEDPIRGKVEIGYDGFLFDGQFPDTTLFGPEIKSKCYIGSVTKYSDLDERLREINEAIAQEVKNERYKNFFSSEVRIAEDDENFEDGEPVLIEPTCRIPSPPFEAELESYKNLGKILWHGSVGEVIPIDMADNFAVVCRISHDDEPENWRAVKVPDEIRQWIKLYDPFYKNETYYTVPRAPFANRIGAVVGIGGTIEKAIEHCAENLESIKDQPINSEFMCLTEALAEIQSAEKQDIKFSDKPIPHPEIVLAQTE